jgi:hypothetical protein
LAQRESLAKKFTPLMIDFQAVKFFFKSLRQNERDSFWEVLSLTAEIISTEFEQEADDYKQLMCIRGLFLLLLHDQVADVMGQETGVKILSTINQILSPAVAPNKRTITELVQHPPSI